DFRTEVLKDLRDAQGKIAELRERLIAAEDQLRRIDIRAPQSGVVYQLSVHTVGGVITPGENVIQVRPTARALVAGDKSPPHEIDQLTLGANVVVRILAGNQRTAPDLKGTLTRIGADLTRDQPQQANGRELPPVASQPGYYLVRISLEEDEARRPGD